MCIDADSPNGIRNNAVILYLNVPHTKHIRITNTYIYAKHRIQQQSIRTKTNNETTLQKNLQNNIEQYTMYRFETLKLQWNIIYNEERASEHWAAS